MIPLLAHLLPFSEESLPCEYYEDRQVTEESYNAGLRKIIEEDAMRTVKPCFRILARNVKIRIEELIINCCEIFRSPSEDRPFQKSLPRLTPNPETRLCRGVGNADLQQASTWNVI